MGQKHALLSPSSAHRWLECTPSARLEEGFPDTSSEAAAEGTHAHALAELEIKEELGLISVKEYVDAWDKLAANDFYCGEMQEHCDEFASYIIEKYNEAGKGAFIFLERKLDFSKYVPEGFGTGDVTIIANKVLDIIDFKYGKGVPVSCENNKQMMLYAVGALIGFDFLYEIEEVRMTIYQPRLDNISTFSLPVSELMEWAEKELKPLADLAFAGEGEFRPGDHCRFCKARPVCKALAEHNMEIAKYDFKNPNLLDVADVAKILTRASDITKWLTDVSDYALDQAVNKEVHFPGFKIVEGRSNRKYDNEKAIIETLSQMGYGSDKVLKPQALIGITDMEKLIGKKTFAEKLSKFVVKPDGKPALVPETDKRPALDSNKAAIKDFS